MPTDQDLQDLLAAYREFRIETGVGETVSDLCIDQDDDGLWLVYSDMGGDPTHNPKAAIRIVRDAAWEALSLWSPKLSLMHGCGSVSLRVGKPVKTYPDLTAALRAVAEYERSRK